MTALLATLAFAAGPAYCPAQNHQAIAAQATPAAGWAASRYDEVAEALFGRPFARDALGAGIARIVTARVTPAGEEGEVQIRITTWTDGRIAASVIRLRSPLHAQLQELYRAHRDASPSALANQVKAERFAISEPPDRLRRLAGAFEDVRAPVALENTLVLDPTRYELWVDGGAQRAYFNLLGPSSGKSSHPLLTWIEDVRREIERHRGTREERRHRRH